ncbi:MAG: phage terminase small subunit [Georgfuchsia sp.]
MTTPARRHFQRVTAAQRTAVDVPEQHINANAYELMLVKLAQDKRSLKDIQSIEKKAEFKRQILPDYDAWVSGALANAAGVQDDVLTTVMVWHIDAGLLQKAVDIARYVIRHKLVLPDQYKRSAGCLLAEEFADMSLKAIAATPPNADDAERLAVLLLDIADLTAEQDMPDEVRAKLYKAIGYAQRCAGDLALAVASLQRAFELHDKVGVKRDIELLERDIKNSAAGAGNPPGAAG